MDIGDIKRRLKESLERDLESCFKLLYSVLDKDKVSYNEYVQIQVNAKRIIKDHHLNQIDYEEYNKGLSKISASLLFFINNLDDSSFQIPRNENDDLTTDDHGNLTDLTALSLGDFDTEMRKVAQLIKSSSIVRAIGFGRQYKLEHISIPSIEEYYKAIENRLENDGNDIFHYHRITTQDLEDRFKNHIVQCFKSSKNTNNKFGVVFRENLYLSLRYLIIGRDKIILNLYTRDDIGIQDNRMLFHTEDKQIINYFTIHFDDAWNNERYKGNVITNINSFEKSIPVNESVYTSLNKLRRNLREIYNNSVPVIHTNVFLNNVVAQTENLRFNYLEINHSPKSLDVKKTFSWYMDNLEEGCSYQSLSFIEFWSNIEEIGSFIRKNKLALETRARIDRIFVVDVSRYKNQEEEEDGKKEHIKTLRFLLFEHYLLAKEHPNYQFKIFFTDRYEWFLREYRNCSIWNNNNNEHVVFLSDYKKDKTTLYFIGEQDDSKRNESKLRKAQDSLRHMNENVKKQYKNLSTVNRKILEECKIDVDDYISLMKKYTS